MSSFDKELMQKLEQTFQVEAAEHLEALNQALLQLERKPDSETSAELLQKAFRDSHSLKGAARAVGIKDVERIAHRMEDVLKQVRDGHQILTPDVCDVLYDALDGIQVVLNAGDCDLRRLDTAFNTILGVEEQFEPIADRTAADGTTAEHTVVLEESKTTLMQPSQENETIRVAVSKLDALMAQAGELVSARINAENRTKDMKNIRDKMRTVPTLWQTIRSQLKRNTFEENQVVILRESIEAYHKMVDVMLAELSHIDAALTHDSLRLGMVSGQLQDEMRRVRMLPFNTQDAILQRAVRDAARSEGKSVRLELTGGEVELDKKVLGRLHDSLLHLVRNAVAHGIESVAERERLNKPAEGCVRITVQQRGNEAHIIFSDDGRGFQVHALRDNTGSVHETDEDVINLAFQSGVTTVSSANEMAGRGVGLDVVRQQIEELQGRIVVDNHPGDGVDICLIVPVSLAMTRVLIILAGGVQYALPLASVEKIVPLEETYFVEGKLRMTLNKQPLSVASLALILGHEVTEKSQPLVIVVAVAEQRIALLVEDVVTEQELAMKSFSKPLVKVKHLAGAALLGNGEPIVILNIADIVRSANGLNNVAIPFTNQTTEDDENVTVEPDHILVVDDSITTRTLEKNILSAAGYQVWTATDGVEALKTLSQHDIDLVVADVEMPNMDGITLTRQLRESDAHGELPIILVTSLESEEDRERGMVAGANAYIVKRGFNQAELLSTIQYFLV